MRPRFSNLTAYARRNPCTVSRIPNSVTNRPASSRSSIGFRSRYSSKNCNPKRWLRASKRPELFLSRWRRVQSQLFCRFSSPAGTAHAFGPAGRLLLTWFDENSFQRTNSMSTNSAKPAYVSLRQYLISRPDIGAFRALLNLAFEPAKPFDPKAARAPRRWLVLFSLLSMLGLGCFMYFNL